MNKFILLASFFVFSCDVSATEDKQTAPACPVIIEQSKIAFDPALFKGKVVLLDFWATWCPPCLKSMPFFNSMRNKYLQDGFEIVAINVDEDTETAHQFLQEHPVDYLMAFDPKGECPKIYDVTAMPSSFLLDKTGKIRKVHFGYRDSDQSILTQQITDLLKE